MFQTLIDVIVIPIILQKRKKVYNYYTGIPFLYIIKLFKYKSEAESDKLQCIQ